MHTSAAANSTARLQCTLHRACSRLQLLQPRPSPPHHVRAAAAAAANATQHTDSSQQQQPPHADHARALSVVLLLNENVRRQTGRSLLQRDQLLRAVELVDSSDYACLVLASSSSSSSRSGGHGGAAEVLFANQAAREVLLMHQQHLQQLPALPAAVSGMLHSLVAATTATTTPGPQQQQQQQCCVLQDVAWPPSTANPQQQQPQQQQLCIPQLLCVPLVSPNDAPFGLALLFDAWQWGDGALGVPGYPRVTPAEIPTTTTSPAAADGDGDSGGVSPLLHAAADAVRQQADAVRALKTQQGLGNKDPAVTAAVSQLQVLKQQLSRLEGLQQAFAPDRPRLLQQLVQSAQEQQQQS